MKEGDNYLKLRIAVADPGFLEKGGGRQFG